MTSSITSPITCNMGDCAKDDRVFEGRTQEDQFLSFGQIKDLQQSTKTQSHKVSGRVSLSLTPAPDAPPSPKIKIPIVMRTLNRRTALLFIFVALLAVALHAASLLYYQYSSLAAVRSEHEAKMLGLELSISDLRSSIASLRLGLLDSRSRSNSWRNSLSTSETNITGNFSDTQMCIPLDYPQYDRVIWSGSDSEREHLYSELALFAEHACYRDSPDHVWRFAVALYYRAALLPLTVAASTSGASRSDATRLNQIAFLKRANETINRALELTRHNDPRVLKWSALINGYAFEIKGVLQEKLAASFHFKATMDRAIELNPYDPQSLHGRANWGFLISGITNLERLLAKQFIGTVPFAHLSDALSDALSADRLYRTGVRLTANGSVAPPGTSQVATLEVRQPGASKLTLTLLAKSYARTLEDSDYSARLLAVAREAYALPATTWEDREADKELAKLSKNTEMSFI